MPRPKKYKGTVYISGPMRGLPDSNFPAFDKAQLLAESLGYKVISPAQMDREDKDQPEKDSEGGNLPTHNQTIKYAKRDTKAVIKSTHIAMLPGFKDSKGAMAEFYLAKWIELPILDAETFEILDENKFLNQVAEFTEKAYG